MDKIARRVAHANRNVARRTQRLSRRQQGQANERNRNVMKDGVAEIRRDIQEARQARKEDWEMGPLAPKRDLGFGDHGILVQPIRQDWSNYGQIKSQGQLAEKRCAWAGGSKMLNLVAGDRVVILEGHDKGKIDTIKSVDASNGTVTLDNHHRVRATREIRYQLQEEALLTQP